MAPIPVTLKHPTQGTQLFRAAHVTELTALASAKWGVPGVVCDGEAVIGDSTSLIPNQVLSWSPLDRTAGVLSLCRCVIIVASMHCKLTPTMRSSPQLRSLLDAAHTSCYTEEQPLQHSCLQYAPHQAHASRTMCLMRAVQLLGMACWGCISRASPR
jgi:hypothetical protein